MKLKKKHLEIQIAQAENDLINCYKLIQERKAYIRILKILKNKIEEL